MVIIPAIAALLAVAGQQTPPHLAQAWQAMSTGDGVKGQTGKESYIYEDCKEPSETCMNGHVWDYGADTCIKYELDAGVHSDYTGTFYVKCDALDCCTTNRFRHDRPDVKKWDIGQAGKAFGDNITYLGTKTTTELEGKVVKADAWNEQFNLPFHGGSVNYTYFVTAQGNQTITHRIEYSATALPDPGVILYGDFKVQNDLDSFRDAFKAPAECLKPNVMKCEDAKVKQWNQKYFTRGNLP